MRKTKETHTMLGFHEWSHTTTKLGGCHPTRQLLQRGSRTTSYTPLGHISFYCLVISLLCLNSSITLHPLDCKIKSALQDLSLATLPGLSLPLSAALRPQTWGVICLLPVDHDSSCALFLSPNNQFTSCHLAKSWSDLKSFPGWAILGRHFWLFQADWCPPS